MIVRAGTTAMTRRRSGFNIFRSIMGPVNFMTPSISDLVPYPLRVLTYSLTRAFVTSIVTMGLTPNTLTH